MIYFREVTEPHPHSDLVRFWHIEHYDEPFSKLFPSAVAYVMEDVSFGIAHLNFIFVADLWRRQGIGREMLQAIMKRWPQPNLRWIKGMDEAGQGLLRSVGLIDEDESDH